MKEVEFKRPEQLPEPTAWDKLPMQHKATMIKVGVKNGLYSVQGIKTAYNRHVAGLDIYGEGGLKRPDPSLADKFANFLDNGGRAESENSQYINKVGQRYYDYSRPDHPLTQNVDFREVVITSDSQLSPEERNYRERLRQKYLADYAEQKAREYTASQLLASQKNWDSSAQKKALDLGIEAAQGVGMASDVTGTLFGGIPVYSGMKGAQALNKATQTGKSIDYVDAGVWLSPMLGVTGKKAYDAAKPVVRSIFQRGTPAAEWASNTTEPFVSELDWSPESWFRRYRPGGKYDAEDVAALKAHVPEYHKIEEEAKKAGTWMRDADGNVVSMDPREWVMRQSKDYKNADLTGNIHYNGVSGKHAEDYSYNGTAWTDLENSISQHFADSRTVYEAIPGRVLQLDFPKSAKQYIVDADGAFWSRMPESVFIEPVKGLRYVDKVADQAAKHGYDVTRINNIVEGNGQKVTDVIIHEGTPRKSVLGNNGNFDLKKKNIYKGLLPFIMAKPVLKKKE